jgi:hypothetical protein
MMTFLQALVLAFSLGSQPPRIDDGSHIPVPRTPATQRDDGIDKRPFYVAVVVIATIALLMWNRRRKLELERQYERDRERAARGGTHDADADDLRDAARGRSDEEGPS